MTWEIAILGDLHGSWDDLDADYFNRSDYAMLLFTGDLGSGTANNGLAIARSIGRLSKPADHAGQQRRRPLAPDRGRGGSPAWAYPDDAGPR